MCVLTSVFQIYFTRFTLPQLVSLTTRISVVIGDVIVLIVTWLKTARAYREAQRLNLESPLATMLFLDGTFAGLVLCKLLIL